MSGLLELGCGVSVKVVCRLMAGSCGVEACKLWQVALVCTPLADLTSILEKNVGAQGEDNEPEYGNADSKSKHSWVNILRHSRGATHANL